MNYLEFAVIDWHLDAESAYKALRKAGRLQVKLEFSCVYWYNPITFEPYFETDYTYDVKKFIRETKAKLYVDAKTKSLLDFLSIDEVNNLLGAKSTLDFARAYVNYCNKYCSYKDMLIGVNANENTP